MEYIDKIASLSLLVDLMGIAAVLAVAVLVVLFMLKLDEVKQLKSSLNQLKRAFDELDEQAKLIVKTDLALNKTQEELDKKITGLYALQKIARLVSTTLDENEIFRRIDESLITDLGFDRSAIFIFDLNRSPQCKLGSRYSRADIDKAQAAISADTVFSPIINNGKILSTLNTPKHTQDRVAQIFHVSYFVIAPIMTQDGIAGIIFAGNKAGDSLLTEGDEELISILANQIGQSLENARLFEQVYHSHQELENKVSVRTKELAAALEEVRNINKMKSDFVSAVSHELRTPLTSIKGFASILMTGKLGAVPPEVKDRLEKINKHSDSLVQLINDLLDISRIEAGRIEMKYEFKPLAPIVEAVADLLSPQLKDKKIILAINVTKDLKPVFVDSGQIQRVFVNLINNAIKFTPPNGRITVRALDAGDFIQTDITDTGIGIAKADQEKIFDEFYRVDNTVNQSLQGTGLGLSLVKRIIEAHRGKIWVRSELNEGATFSFTLPKTPV
ncbi:MAG: sensor histidine kinase [Candidatus Omnitrophota bacterium]